MITYGSVKLDRLNKDSYESGFLVCGKEVILMDNTQKYKIEDIPSELKDFLEELLRDANVTQLDQKTHDDMIVELYTRLDDYILGTIMEKLPEDKMEEFTKMAEDNKNREELQSYLQTQIPEANEIFAKAMIDFRDLYLGKVDEARMANNQNGE